MRIKDKTRELLYYRSANPRQKRFRRIYAIGDIVSGYVLKYVGDKMALVRIDDLNLLARIRPGYPEEKILSFQVIALFPEIKLQEMDMEDRPGINLLV
jgi:hypothetical protein